MKLKKIYSDYDHKYKNHCISLFLSSTANQKWFHNNNFFIFFISKDFLYFEGKTTWYTYYVLDTDKLLLSVL